jgi:hypothetical protein
MTSAMRCDGAGIQFRAEADQPDEPPFLTHPIADCLS